MSEITTSYYTDAIDLGDPSAVEADLQRLLNTPIDNVEDLEAWLSQELTLSQKIEEVLAGHTIDFYRDTDSAKKRDVHMHDQTVIQPILLRYKAELDRKFCECPYTLELDESRYGLMRKVRATGLELFREENIPLKVREQALIAKYNEIIGGLTAEWEGEQRPYPYVVSKVDSPDRFVRETAWKATRAARKTVKQDIDEMMNELVQLRHQIALNAGFENYRDYSFIEHHREYTVEDCRRFHDAVEKHVVPLWDRLANTLQQALGVETYRPWDITPCTLSGAPFEHVEQLMDGVERMLEQTDPYFQECFIHMRKSGLLDLESRQGKAPGGFCEFLQHSRNTFVFANFSPSFFAVIALIHEMGHAINGYLQIRDEPSWSYLRAEVAELYSHGMELLCLDKLQAFYPDPKECKNAQREELHRSLNMLMGPLSGDLFQHWLYENPHHSPAERDEKFREVSKRFTAHPVDFDGFEQELGEGWIDSIHFIAYPFYNIEYSMSELGALQLLETYRNDPARAVANFKQGASADFNQSIAKIYEETGVSFDFTEEAIEKTARSIETLLTELA